MRIFVRDNNVDQALAFSEEEDAARRLEIKAHAAYEKPSEKRVREKAESICRAKKLARKKMQREGLLPMPKPKPKPVGRPNPFAATMSTMSNGASGWCRTRGNGTPQVLIWLRASRID